LESGLVLPVAQCQFAIQNIKKFEALVHMRLRFGVSFHGKELGKIRIHMPIGNHVTEALKRIGWGIRARLRQAHAILEPMHAEHRRWLALEEVRKILREHHRDARKIPQRRHDSTGLWPWGKN